MWYKICWIKLEIWLIQLFWIDLVKWVELKKSQLSATTQLLKHSLIYPLSNSQRNVWNPIRKVCIKIIVLLVFAKITGKFLLLVEVMNVYLKTEQKMIYRISAAIFSTGMIQLRSKELATMSWNFLRT